MENKTKLNIHKLIDNVNQNNTGIYNRTPELIAKLPRKISKIIGSRDVYISEFIIAKVKGKIEGIKGHEKINDEVLEKIPQNLSRPHRIMSDSRKNDRKEYLFINIDPLHQIVVEVERKSSGLTEINTVFETTPSELKRLEGKLPTVFSSGETPLSRIHASP